LAPAGGGGQLAWVDQDCGGGDYRYGRAGNAVMAVAAHRGRISLRQPDGRAAAGGAEPRSRLAAEILRPGAAGRREPGARRTSRKPSGAGGGGTALRLHGGDYKITND